MWLLKLHEQTQNQGSANHNLQDKDSPLTEQKEKGISVAQCMLIRDNTKTLKSYINDIKFSYVILPPGGEWFSI